MAEYHRRHHVATNKSVILLNFMKLPINTKRVLEIVSLHGSQSRFQLLIRINANDNWIRNVTDWIIMDKIDLGDYVNVNSL